MGFHNVMGDNMNIYALQRQRHEQNKPLDAGVKV